MAIVERARADGYVALKSIIAYRSGLQVEDVSKGDAKAAFAVLKEEARRQGRIRLANKGVVRLSGHAGLGACRPPGVACPVPYGIWGW